MFGFYLIIFKYRILGGWILGFGGGGEEVECRFSLWVVVMSYLYGGRFVVEC